MNRIKCNAITCEFNSSNTPGTQGICQCWGEVTMETCVTSELDEHNGALRCMQFKEDAELVRTIEKDYLEKQLYGWDTAMVDQVVRRYRDAYDADVGEECEEPTIEYLTWRYGLEDAGYLMVYPVTDAKVRVEHIGYDGANIVSDFYVVRKVIFDVWDTEFREIE